MTMNLTMLKNIPLLIVLLLFTISCSVISREIRNEAMAPMPFRTLAENAGQYTGQTVILGGFILSTENKADETLITVLQTPLSSMDYPSGKDQSQGRFIVVHKGFLDPEVYRQNRRITVAGTIAGLRTEQIGSCPYACLTIESRQIYLWKKNLHRDYYWDDPYWRHDPFYWYGGPYYDPYYGGYYRAYRYYPSWRHAPVYPGYHPYDPDWDE
ncbi:MAG: Slp family lipoprotein [Thermodesulfobacteriota bacterium]